MAVVGALAVTLTALGVGVAQADGEAHPISNAANGMCLQPENGSFDAVVIVQATCNGSSAQRWFFAPFGGTNRYQFSNLFSHLCFDAPDTGINGGILQQNQCAPISNDMFQASRKLPDRVSLMSRAGNRNTNLCIDGSAPPGTVVRLFQCDGSAIQQWVVGFG
jgi:Ricin-type beta-trefoil lectin domain-like